MIVIGKDNPYLSLNILGQFSEKIFILVDIVSLTIRNTIDQM